MFTVGMQERGHGAKESWEFFAVFRLLGPFLGPRTDKHDAEMTKSCSRGKPCGPGPVSNRTLFPHASPEVSRLFIGWYTQSS